MPHCRRNNAGAAFSPATRKTSAPDHRRIVDMLTRLPVTHGTQCRQLVDDLTSELIRHAVAEDLRLYPAVCAIVPEPAVDVVREIGAHARPSTSFGEESGEGSRSFHRGALRHANQAISPRGLNGPKVPCSWAARHSLPEFGASHGGQGRS
jgi:hypothetical protein